MSSRNLCVLIISGRNPLLSVFDKGHISLTGDGTSKEQPLPLSSSSTPSESFVLPLLAKALPFLRDH